SHPASRRLSEISLAGATMPTVSPGCGDGGTTVAATPGLRAIQELALTDHFSRAFEMQNAGFDAHSLLSSRCDDGHRRLHPSLVDRGQCCGARACPRGHCFARAALVEPAFKGMSIHLAHKLDVRAIWELLSITLNLNPSLLPGEVKGRY